MHVWYAVPIILHVEHETSGGEGILYDLLEPGCTVAVDRVSRWQKQGVVSAVACFIFARRPRVQRVSFNRLSGRFPEYLRL